MDTALILNGVGDILLHSGEITRVRNGYGAGWAAFPLQTDLATFLTPGRIVTVWQYEPVNPNYRVNLGAFVIQGSEEDPVNHTMRVYGPDLAEELAKMPIWEPIGEETTESSLVAEAIPAPWFTTLLVGAPRNNDSLSPVANPDGIVRIGDEVRVTMNGGAGVHVSTIRDTVFFEGRWRHVMWDRIPANADAGNQIEYRRREVTVTDGESGPFLAGTKVTLTMNTGTLVCLAAKDPSITKNKVYLSTGITAAVDVGRAITVKSYEMPATDDVTQIVSHATGGWSVDFPEDALAEGTADGTSHPATGASVLELLNLTAARTGEFWRLAAPEADGTPRLLIKWRATPDRAGISGSDNVLFQAGTASSTWASNLYAVVDDAGYKKETVPYTRLYPVAGDKRVTLSHCSDTAVAAALARGYTVVTDEATLGLWGIPYIHRTVDDEVWATTEPFSHIRAETNKVDEIRETADQLLKEAVEWLDGHPKTFREYFDVTAFVHEAYSPGTMFDLQFTGPATTINRATDGTALVINRATYRVAPDTAGSIRATIQVNDRVTSGAVLPEPTADRAQRVADYWAKEAIMRSGGDVNSTRVSVSGGTPLAPGTGSAAPTAGNTAISVVDNAISAVNIAHPVYNMVMDYGADKTGSVDITTKLRDVLEIADAAGGGTIYFPRGTYKITVYDKDDSNRLVLPENCVLRGEGYGTVLKVNASVDYLSGGSRKYAIIDVQSNSKVERLRIDGNKSNIALTGTDTKFNGLRVTSDALNVIIRNVWIHDLDATSDQEAFGIETRSGCGQVTIANVTAWNIAGSGISISNDEPLPGVEAVGGGHFRVTNCRCYDNDWQGITVYGAQHVQVSDCVAYDNTKIGFNVEYSGAVMLTGCEAYGNGEQNLRVMGYSHVIANGCYFHDSDGTNEISIQQGGYYREIDGDDPIACPSYVGLYNCRVVRGTDTGDGSSVRHLQLRTTEETTGKTLFGGGYPVVTVDGPGTQGWEIAGWRYEDGSATLRVYPPGLTLKGWSPTRPIATRRFEDWTMTGDITRDLSVVAGSVGTYPATFSGTAENAQAYTDTVLLGNRRYHVKVRAKVTQSTGATIDDPDIWSVTFNRVGGAGAGPGRFALGALSYSGDWVEGEGIIETGAGTFRPGLFYQSRSATASGASTITLDYLVVTEMGWTQGATEFDQWGAKRIDHGDSIPISGTWHGGDAVLRSNPTEPGGIGWTVEQAGTYGTLTDVTGSITDGSTSATFAGDNLDLLEPGHYVTLAGDETVYQIVYISSGAATITPRAVTTLSSVAVSWSEPVWKEWGIVGAPRELVLPMEPEDVNEPPEAIEYRAELARATYGKAYIRWVEEI
jgi:hypothetical protein